MLKLKSFLPSAFYIQGNPNSLGVEQPSGQKDTFTFIVWFTSWFKWFLVLIVCLKLYAVTLTLTGQFWQLSFCISVDLQEEIKFQRLTVIQRFTEPDMSILAGVKEKKQIK